MLVKASVQSGKKFIIQHHKQENLKMEIAKSFIVLVLVCVISVIRAIPLEPEEATANQEETMETADAIWPIFGHGYGAPGWTGGTYPASWVNPSVSLEPFKGAIPGTLPNSNFVSVPPNPSPYGGYHGPWGLGALQV